MFKKFMVIALLTLFIAACGGGSSGDSTYTPITGLRNLAGTVTITPPVNGTLYVGDVLTVKYSGTENITFTYQWYKGDVAIDGATESTFTTTEAGEYKVTVSAVGYKSKTSIYITINILDGVLVVNDFDKTYNTGDEISAWYTGEDDVTYQWYKDGEIIHGATDSTYTPKEKGEYHVVISAERGKAPQTSVTITVSDSDELNVGVEWSTIDSSILQNLEYSAMTYINGRFYLMGSDNLEYAEKLYYSYDGEAWLQIVLDKSLEYIGDITYSNGLYILTGGDYDQNAYIATSTDGINFISINVVNSFMLGPVAVGGGIIVVADNEEGYEIMYSTDGGKTLLYTETNIYALMGGTVFDVIYANGKFIAVGEYGNIITSTDGKTWTKAQTNASYDLYKITYHNGIFIAVGESGNIAISIDGGTAWIGVTIAGYDNLTDVIYGGGRFVIVGNNSTIRYAEADSDLTRPTSWISVTLDSITDTLATIAYGNGKFVVVCGYWYGVSNVIVSPNLKPLTGALTIANTINDGFNYAGDTLHASYNGNEAVKYQWKINGKVIPSATEADIVTGVAGYYTVTISINGYDSITSNTIMIVYPTTSGPRG